MFKSLIKKSNHLLKLGRYDKPSGSFLLMWPCFWGAMAQINNEILFIKYLLLFFAGSFVMRGAGCCINDYFDKDLDKEVKRTQKRPLASGKLKLIDALLFTIFQLFIGLLVVLQFQSNVIVISFLIIPFVFIYPLLKRFTHFPQVLLGLVFNWGVIIGYLSQNNVFDYNVLYLYFGGVFLTIAYDTIYGFQDIDDDKRIGVKSLSILIEKKSTLNLSILYLISFLSFTLFFFSFYDDILENVLYSLIILISLSFQVFKFSKNETLIKIFNSNIMFGGLIAILIITRNYL